jgi:solute carrier family 10 (sodium/bile acid cotransporter), member 7
MLPRFLRRFRPDSFVVALVATVAVATLLPCQGTSADVFRVFGWLAVASLFFLQGARLSHAALVAGAEHWRLHAAITCATFLLFPLLGLGLWVAVPDALPRSLWSGVLFVCVLPSTVQSSVALTSIARGNVAAAICSAAGSNVAGLFLTPILFGLLSGAHGSAVSLTGIGQVVCQLLVPFAAGQLLRPWIGQWAERNRSILSVTDRGSILLIVYTAFSASVVQGIWQRVPMTTLAILALIAAILLSTALLIMISASRALRFGHPDESAIVFCGSQKSVVSGIPIASALIGGPALGLFVLPVMIYRSMQLLVCAWLAKRYAKHADPPPRRQGRQLPSRPDPSRRCAYWWVGPPTAAAGKQSRFLPGYLTIDDHCRQPRLRSRVNSSNCNILSSGCIDFDRETAGRGHSSGRPALRRPSRYRTRSSGDIKIAPARPNAGAAPGREESTWADPFPQPQSNRKRPPDGARTARRCRNWPTATTAAFPPCGARHEQPRFCIRTAQVNRAAEKIFARRLSTSKRRDSLPLQCFIFLSAACISWRLCRTFPK